MAENNCFNDDNKAYLNNDVIDQIRTHLGSSSKDNIISISLKTFSQKDIIDAKKLLVSTTWDRLSEIDPNLAEKVKKPRRNTQNRSSSDVILSDIIKIMHALESDDVEINTDPKNPQRVCYVNPEIANINAMLTRLDLVENENSTLKKRVDEQNIKHESMEECIKELKESINELKESNKELKVQNKDILKITATGGSPLPPLSCKPADISYNASPIAPVSFQIPSSQLDGAKSLPGPTAPLTNEYINKENVFYLGSAATTYGVTSKPLITPTKTSSNKPTELPLRSTPLCANNITKSSSPMSLLYFPKFNADTTVTDGSNFWFPEQKVKSSPPAFSSTIPTLSDFPTLQETLTNTTAAIRNSAAASLTAIGNSHKKPVTQFLQPQVTNYAPAGNFISGGARPKHVNANKLKRQNAKPYISGASVVPVQPNNPQAWPNSLPDHQTGNSGQIEHRNYSSGVVPTNESQPKNEKKSLNYRCGTASDPQKSLTANKPMFWNNKCLVIKGIANNINVSQIYEKINKIADKKIQYLHQPVILSKMTQHNRTMVFELNEEDYGILSNENIWDNTVKVAEFVGNRFWRKNNVKYTPTQMKNSVRDSWQH